MKIIWKDTSSFSKGAEDRTPKEWSAAIGDIRIVVHHHIHYPPDQWLMSTHGGLQIFSCERLVAVSAEQACKEATGIVRDWFLRHAAMFSKPTKPKVKK